MIAINQSTFSEYFRVEKVTKQHNLMEFQCEHEECTQFLQHDAIVFHENHLANTFLFTDKHEKQRIAAFISLVADAVKLEEPEKTWLSLPHIPFETLPALKIAKLAVHRAYRQQYRGIGSAALAFARIIAYLCNRDYIACRALTVDADIEYDPNLPQFYEKNGFKSLQNSRYSKKTKTRPMYANIF
jgi:ribosomal protein S18 acetylase RimI-like enzyme